MKIERDLLVALLLGIIVLIGALQAIQLTGLKNGVSAGTGVASAPATAAAASPGASSPSAPAQQAAIPTSLQNLPNMVGGC